jgi:hypothetical protein
MLRDTAPDRSVARLASGSAGCRNTRGRLARALAVLEQGDLVQAARLAGLDEAKAAEAAKLLVAAGIVEAGRPLTRSCARATGPLELERRRPLSRRALGAHTALGTIHGRPARHGHRRRRTVVGGADDPTGQDPAAHLRPLYRFSGDGGRPQLESDELIEVSHPHRCHTAATSAS